MSFLSPLFLLGALAVAGPIVFHLIRRSARDRMPFSSVMFLRPIPPRSARRRKLEHVLLLALRCLCLVLIATGFSRPFFAKKDPVPQAPPEGRRIILLLDTSASMRRPGVWEKARAIAERYIDKASPNDQLALFGFDRSLHPILNFNEYSPVLARQRLASMSSGWMGTQLGSALTGAAEQGNDIVLISDLQEGAKLDGLQGHDWPAHTRVLVERVDAKPSSNAGLEIVETDSDAHVRVANASDSRKEAFRVTWEGGTGMDIYVPAGQTRTFTAPKPPGKTGALKLSSDDAAFDNVSYFAAPETEEVTVSYLGADSPDDPSRLLYYLQRVFPSTPRRHIRLATNSLVLGAALAVIPGNLDAQGCAAARSWIAGGKCAVMVLTNTHGVETLAGIMGEANIQMTEGGGEFALLGQIDFKHPVFAPFADPRFSDFSRIHFWKHRRWDGGHGRVLAAFDDGSPALTEIEVGKGWLLVLASGWQPSDSELALSTKFPPLMEMILEQAVSGSAQRWQFRTGDLIPSPITSGSAVQWQTPDGNMKSLAAGVAFGDTDVPGIYQARWDGKARQFAVNLPLEESRTAPMALDQLGRLGVPLSTTFDVLPERSREAQQRSEAEVESRQKIWKWAIAAALAVAVGEIVVGGALSGRT